MLDYAMLGLLLAIVVLLMLHLHLHRRTRHRPLLTSDFHSVTLLSGEVFHGRLFHLGTDYPVLHDARRICLTAEEAPSAQQAASHGVLVQRLRDDTDGADHLILSAQAIAYVKPVHPESTVGQALAKLSR